MNNFGYWIYSSFFFPTWSVLVCHGNARASTRPRSLSAISLYATGWTLMSRRQSPVGRDETDIKSEVTWGRASRTDGRTDESSGAVPSVTADCTGKDLPSWGWAWGRLGRRESSPPSRGTHPPSRRVEADCFILSLLFQGHHGGKLEWLFETQYPSNNSYSSCTLLNVYQWKSPTAAVLTVFLVRLDAFSRPFTSGRALQCRHLSSHAAPSGWGGKLKQTMSTSTIQLKSSLLTLHCSRSDVSPIHLTNL